MVGKILEKDQYNFGFDAQNSEYGNLVSKGIIDPTKVVRTALQDAASIAGLLITTEAMVAELPKKQAPVPGDASRRRHGLLSLPLRQRLLSIRKARAQARAFLVGRPTGLGRFAPPPFRLNLWRRHRRNAKNPGAGPGFKSRMRRAHIAVSVKPI